MKNGIRKVAGILSAAVLAVMLSAGGAGGSLITAEAAGKSQGGPGYNTTRETQYGAVKGTLTNGSVVWYGIPYAAAPVGELRWKAPAAPETTLCWTSPAPSTG